MKQKHRNIDPSLARSDRYPGQRRLVMKSIGTKVLCAGAIIAAISSSAMAANYSVDWLDMSPTALGGAVTNPSPVYNLPGYGNVQVSYTSTTLAWNRTQNSSSQNGSISSAGNNYSWSTRDSMDSVNFGSNGTSIDYQIVFTFLSGAIPTGQLVLGSYGLGQSNASGFTTAIVSQNGTFLNDWDLGSTFGATSFTGGTNTFTLQNSLTEPTVGYFNTDLGVTRIDDSVSSLTLALHHIGQDGIGFSVGRLSPIPEPQAVIELASSAIPMNLAIGQISASVHNHGIHGINSRLFRARGKTIADTNVQRLPESYNYSSKSPIQQCSTSTTDPDAVASGENWEYFASVNFGNVGLDNLGANPGLDSYTYSSTVGFEYKASQQLALGLGWSHVWNDNTMNGGLGSVDIEGDAAIIYATYLKNNFWTDMLYSYGSYDADIRRNNGGGTSVASPDIQAHQVSLNMGYNIEAETSNGWLDQLTEGDNRLVYGPTLGVDYSFGALDGYAETGSPGFDAAFSEQNYDSLITRVGGQATQTTGTSWGQFKSQLRLEYARENCDQGNSVSGSLVSNPLVTATQTDISPGADWLEAGAGISLDFANSNVSVYLDYTGQYFRQDVTAHYATIRAKISF